MPKKPHGHSTITPSETYSIAVDEANSDLHVGGFVNFLITGNQPPPNPLSSGLSVRIVATIASGAQFIVNAGLADRTLALLDVLKEPAHCQGQLYIPAVGEQSSLATCEFDVTA